MAVFVAEPELGLSETSLPDLRSMVGRLPFEGAMLQVALLMDRLEPRLNDPAGHWEIAQQFYRSRPELLSAYQRVLSKHPTRTVFSPQPLMLLMRLLLEHARHEPMRELTGREFRLLQDSVLGAHSAMEVALDAMGLPTRDAILAYELQAAALFRRPQLLEEMARHQELEKRAALPGTEIDDIERIWPVVVSVGHVMQTANLWGYIRSSMDDRKAASLAQSRVQPLQLMDIEDYEKLMGLVEAGESLPAMLAHKVNGPYRERDFAAWLHSPGAPSDQARLSVLKQRWQAMAERVTSLSDQAARVGSGDGGDGNPPAD